MTSSQLTPEDIQAVRDGRLEFPGKEYSLFDLLRNWTYSAIHENLDCNSDQWHDVVLAHAQKLNENLRTPGTPEDVAIIANQSARWTRQTFVMSVPEVFKQSQRLMAQRRNREAGRELKAKPKQAPKVLNPHASKAALGMPLAPMRRESWAGSRPMWRDDT